MGAFYALSSALFWAIGNLYIRRGQAKDSSDDGLYLSVLVNAVLFLLLSLFIGIFGAHPPISWHGIAFFVLAGVLTTFLGRMFNFISIRRLGPSRAASFKVVAPMFTLLFAFIFMGERLNTFQLIGIGVVITGLWLLTQDVGGASSDDPPPPPLAIRAISNRKGAIEPGILFGFLAAASFGTGHVARKLALEILPSPYLGATIGSWVAVATLIVSGKIQGTQPRWLDPQFYLGSGKREFIIAGVLTSFAQLLLFLAFATSAVSTASVLAATEPMMTLIISPLLLRHIPEKITNILIAGSILVVAGTIIIVLQ